MRKSRKWGLAETPSAQFRLELHQSKCTYPTYLRQFYKSAVRTVAASANRSEDIANFPQKSRFLGVSRGCFSRLSPHPGQSGKSHLLSILIIYRYMHACQVSGKSYGNFLRSRLKSIKMSMIWTGNGRRLGGAPTPPRLSKFSQKETATKNDGAALQLGLHCRRKAGGPARLRSGERGPTGIAARSTSHSLRYAALRSDWVRWLMEAR